MPALFDDLGIQFQYPENWRLEQEDAQEGGDSVTVYSPGGAFWSLIIHPRTADPARLAKAAVDAMRQEYEELEAESVQEIIAGRDTVGYDLNFFYLDLTNTAAVRSLRTNRRTYTIFCQAEDREFQQIQTVFLAITTSWVRSLDAAGETAD
jgi:hypothetical protein